MTENELIEQGFQKEIVFDLDSNNGYDYYYYILELCEGFSLVSKANDEIKNDDWAVTSFDLPVLEIKTEETLINFLNVMRTVIDCDYV